MPFADPEKRRAANAERMRRRRAEGTAWIDPVKEAERKARWYREQADKQKIVDSTRQRRQQAKDQELAAFRRKLLEP